MTASTRRPRRRLTATTLTLAGGVVALVLVLAPAATAAGPFIGPFSNVQTLSTTLPKNRDVNPYGVAVVPTSSTGSVSLFADLAANKLPGACPGGLGLTTALVALRSGWVIVGSLPTKNGSSGSMQAGCLIVLSPDGQPVETISGGQINGPWDMTADDQGSTATLFVSNVLNGTVAGSPDTVDGGTVVRIPLSIPGSGMPTVGPETVIGNGFPERTDPAALVVGPTGLGLGSDGTLYVADSVDNSIVAIPDAGTRAGATDGATVSANGFLDDPLGLAIAPNGDILTANGGDGNLIETTPAGQQVAVKILDTTPAPPGPNGNGTLFGLAVVPDGSGVYFVDDGTNTLDLLH